jgi:hypothetical protein
MQREIAHELARGDASSRVPKKAPSSAKGPGSFDVFPRTATSGKSEPALLSDLERLLQEKLRLGRRLTGNHANDEREDENGAALDAYGQTFDAFVEAFTAYKPLLSEIQTRYDRVLDEALRSERECAGLRAEIAAAERRRLAEVRDARAESISKAANLRGDALRRAAAAEALVAAAEARAVEADAETARWRTHADAADTRAVEAESARAALLRRIEAETSWAESRGVGAADLLASEMIPLPEDFVRADAALEAGEGWLNREKSESSECAEVARKQTAKEAVTEEVDAPKDENG